MKTFQFSLGLLTAFSAGITLAAQVCDPNIAITRPNSRYEAVIGATPAGSEVKDKVTKLIWQRCVRGMSWNGTACTGTFTTHTWNDALEQARLAATTTATPATAWRLPNRNELLSLIDLACVDPAMNNTWFPNHPLYSGGFNSWTSTTAAPTTLANYAWQVYVGFGNDNYVLKTTLESVRLVRSSP